MATFPSPTLQNLTVNGVTSVQDSAGVTQPVTQGQLASTAAGKGAALVGTLQNGTGAAPRTALAKLNESVSVVDFGADPTGVADSTTAFVNALATGKSVLIPDGHYLVTEGAITIATNGQALRGTAETTYATGSYTGGGVLIECTTNAGQPVLAIGANVTWPEIGNMAIIRSAAPGTLVAGSSGIKCNGLTEYANIHNVIVNNCFIGFELQSTGYSYFRYCAAQNCTNAGVYISNTPGFNACQWQISQVISQGNGSSGFIVTSFATGGSTQVSMGNWDHVSTYANTGHGLQVSGVAGCPIQSMRVDTSFFGQDNSDEIYLSSYGTNHQFSNIFIELAGTIATGPTLGTPASNIGHGMSIDANNAHTSISNCIINNNSYSGIDTSCNGLVISNCQITNNSHSAPGTYTGITVNAAGVINTITGCLIANTTASTQNYGIYNNGTLNVCVGNDLKTNLAGNYGGVAAIIGGATLNNQ